MKPKNFLFVGNGPYTNRGCEAIVRGTTAILEKVFSPDIRIFNACGTPETAEENAREETDPRIKHIPLYEKRFSLGWWRNNSISAISARLTRNRRILRPKILDAYVADGTMVLEAGGDNYTLDYCIPYEHIDIDRYIMSRGGDVCLWGASVGPFDQQPLFAEEMFAHLRGLRAITVRETITKAYLEANGVSDNVCLVADPAFMMKPKQPATDKWDLAIPEGSIGVNLSPLMSMYVCDGDMQVWRRLCVDVVERIAMTTDRPIVFIPHVMQKPDNCDYSFLLQIRDALNNRGIHNIINVSDQLSASELKWVIQRLSFFLGARTHATIAAYSCGIPTLSFAYSVKAIGLSRDIMGSDDYCITVNDLTAECVANRVANLIANEAAIRSCLANRIPDIEAKSVKGGEFLAKILAE
ncbi:MAG: polysaccharide pyruvyl transferase family protein [Armatimonadota bacterium]|nr:polysaccharide pyruvyl transferase family protein [bacterium]